MVWLVHFHDEFEPEVMALPRSVRVELLASVRVLATMGPTLGRPHVDSLAGLKRAKN